MAKVSVPREQIADGSLPSVCIVCGAEAPHRLFPNIGAPSLLWVLFSPLIGLITFWIYILLAAGGSANKGGLPFCERHQRYWTRRAWFIVVGFSIIGLVVAAAALTPTAAPGQKDDPHWLFGLGGCWALVFLPSFLVVHLTATRPTGGSRESLVLSGASREFASAIEENRRR